MKKYCVISTDRCPSCKRDLMLSDNSCDKCGAPIRLININRLKNDNFKRSIVRFDKLGNLDQTFNSVYDAYPIDEKYEHKKRARVIKVCDSHAGGIFDGYRWRYADCTDTLECNDVCGVAAKSVVQVDFHGRIMCEYRTINDASEKLQHTATTISKACKRRVPIPGDEYFLFFKADFCWELFDISFDRYKKDCLQFKIVDDHGELVGIYSTYEDAAKDLGVTANTISNWCRSIYHPSGKWKNYKMDVLSKPATRVNEYDGCGKSASTQCFINSRYVEIQKKNLVLLESIQHLEKEVSNLKQTNIELLKQNEKMRKQYRTRNSRVDKRIRFMLPVQDFIFDGMHKLFAGVCIYVLCDEEGRRYVGQSQKNDYSRILDHFEGRGNESVYNAYCAGVKFFIEKVVIGWCEEIPFNLNDAEAYFIDCYDSYNNGYNRTRGNHLELMNQFDNVIADK